ncbi:MAG: hypothetical protein AAFY22_11975 [Pseudomonadota bacterium]
MIGFFLAATLICLALGGLYWLWARRIDAEVREGADIEWSHLQEAEPSLLEGYDKERFLQIYRRVHFPRFPGHALAAVCAFVVSLPVTFAAIGASIWLGERLGWIPEPARLSRYIPLGDTSSAEEGYCDAECRLYLVEAYAGFYFFFAILAIWLVIVAVVMRRYHARRPGYLREELIRNRP